MKKPLINFKTARIIEIVSIVLMLILSGLTALLDGSGLTSTYENYAYHVSLQ